MWRCRHGRLERTGLGVVGLLLVFMASSVSGAVAARAPTPAERNAIQRGVRSAAFVPNSGVAKNDQIVSIAVSRVDPRYALARLTAKSGTHTVMVLHHGNGVWWMQQVGASLACDTAPKAVLDDLKVACHPPDGVAWISNCWRLQTKPTSIVIACADGNYALLGLHWRRWGSATATATGTARVNDCVPYCARGHFHDYPVTVTANTLTKCGATPDYADVTIAYKAGRPSGLAKDDRHVLGC